MVYLLQIDFGQDELRELLEDNPYVGLPPLRLRRASRMLPRTRQSERVQATMRSRTRNNPPVRQRAQMDMLQVS